MPERTVVIASSSGLHARPAKIFVQAAARQGTPVRIRVGDGRPVPANSMLAVLALGATHGTQVTLDAEGPGADEALDALAEVLARDLDADENASGSTDENTSRHTGGSAAGAAGETARENADGNTPGTVGGDVRG